MRLYWCGMGTMPSATNTNPTMPVRRSIDRDLEMVAARGGEATAGSSTADWPQAQGVMHSARAIPEKLWTEEESNMFPIHQRLAMTILSTVLLAGAAFAELKTYCFDSKQECQESQQAVKGGSVSGCYQYKVVQYCYDWDSQGGDTDLPLENSLGNPAFENTDSEDMQADFGSGTLDDPYLLWLSGMSGEPVPDTLSWLAFGNIDLNDYSIPFVGTWEGSATYVISMQDGNSRGFRTPNGLWISITFAIHEDRELLVITIGSGAGSHTRYYQIAGR
jgi:hypothetical protein